ncbi:peptide chain release factor N(5)-glutamine methyltransferase [Coxiella endosymbiont of Amblyomma nuttalli]|uniref:peptide chain release factor N(5)-glutamine methyltransferase n=1 Tax=Coxiella endosymbiont of Amblyomma nuttalli TaxID=2749996 RepID=UPI001BAD6D52|nr:peptide chain release factor N(5)-glutamine methyltransferase [Coxiella endosymbiont of Amblyomma nuttalli]QTS83575.1 Release factor glutamine methyltransferase [Coxiella endosymbiont of Amblyomma nuttalli]
MTIVKKVIRNISCQLDICSETPYLDAAVLVSHVLEKSRVELFTHPDMQIMSIQRKQLTNYVNRRISGEPMAYILGAKEFWSLNLTVTPDVLIPRPETEMLVEWILKNLPKDATLRVADLGTGSGNIAIAIASERPHWEITAVDNSKKALKVAKINAKKHHIRNINFYFSEWCQALTRLNYHVIIGNPPYIPNYDKHLQQLKYEPLNALASGPDGLSSIKIIIEEAKSYLTNDGWLLLEHGFDQSQKIVDLMQKAHYHEIQDHVDLASLPRMIVARG